MKTISTLQELNINSDVFVNDLKYFEKQKEVLGNFQWRVARDGVNLNGLLQTV